MTPKEIYNKLKNQRLSTHERESLQQYLHYLYAEGLATPRTPRAPKREAPAQGRTTCR